MLTIVEKQSLLLIARFTALLVPLACVFLEKLQSPPEPSSSPEPLS